MKKAIETCERPIQRQENSYSAKSHPAMMKMVAKCHWQSKLVDLSVRPASGILRLGE